MPDRRSLSHRRVGLQATLSRTVRRPSSCQLLKPNNCTDAVMRTRLDSIMSRAKVKLCFYSRKRHALTTDHSKKLSCRRDAARCFVSLNLSLSHSMSFEMTRLSRACVSPTSIPLQLCLYLVPFLRHLASNNSMTLKSVLGVVKCHWKWHNLTDRIMSFL